MYYRRVDIKTLLYHGSATAAAAASGWPVGRLDYQRPRRAAAESDTMGGCICIVRNNKRFATPRARGVNYKRSVALKSRAISRGLVCVHVYASSGRYARRCACGIIE